MARLGVDNSIIGISPQRIWKPWMLRENIHLGWSQSPEEENIKYILESRNAPGLNLDARS